MTQHALNLKNGCAFHLPLFIVNMLSGTKKQHICPRLDTFFRLSTPLFITWIEELRPSSYLLDVDWPFHQFARHVKPRKKRKSGSETNLAQGATDGGESVSLKLVPLTRAHFDCFQTELISSFLSENVSSGQFRSCSVSRNEKGEKLKAFCLSTEHKATWFTWGGHVQSLFIYLRSLVLTEKHFTTQLKSSFCEEKKLFKHWTSRGNTENPVSSMRFPFLSLAYFRMKSISPWRCLKTWPLLFVLALFFSLSL